jgi:hypothetical protein
MQSLSPRNCARHDSHPGGRAGAIEGKHLALVPRKTLEKPAPPQRCARDRLNGQTCSLRCDLLSGAGFAQAISCESHIGKRPGDLMGLLARCEKTWTRNSGKCSKRKEECLNDWQFFRSPKPSSETRRDDSLRKGSTLLTGPEHDARMRCSPRSAHNRWQPSRSTGVPDAANTPA